MTGLLISSAYFSTANEAIFEAEVGQPSCYKPGHLGIRLEGGKDLNIGASDAKNLCKWKEQRLHSCYRESRKLSKHAYVPLPVHVTNGNNCGWFNALAHHICLLHIDGQIKVFKSL